GVKRPTPAFPRSRSRSLGRSGTARGSLAYECPNTGPAIGHHHRRSQRLRQHGEARACALGAERRAMDKLAKKPLRCAIYTRKSTEHNLDLEFNSLDAQREACEAYIKSQAHEGWRLVPDRFDDGGISGASLDRPALQELLSQIQTGKIDIVVVYKVDRLTRSLTDLAKLVDLFDGHKVSF